MPDSKMRRDGDPEGQAEVAFDPKKGANYHLDRNGDRVYHGVPEGFKFDGEGFLSVDLRKAEAAGVPAQEPINPTTPAAPSAPEKKEKTSG